MGLFHSHSGGAIKFTLASVLIGTLHFFEDMALVFAGRYTDVNIGIIILGGIIFSLCVAGMFRLNFIKKHII